jgi:hypothetical protein
MDDRQTLPANMGQHAPRRGAQIVLLEAATSFFQRMVDSGIAVDFGEEVAQRMFGDLPQPYRAHGAAKRRYRKVRRNLRGW